MSIQAVNVVYEKKITGPLLPTTLLWHKVDVREENSKACYHTICETSFM